MESFFTEHHASLVQLRREIHQHPELGFEEFKTSEKVKTILTQLGIPYIDNLGETGIVATITGQQQDNGRRIGLRADMDALPLQEKNTHDYASNVAGCMHACGHDGHTTILVGVAQYLAQHRDFSGTIYLIFQPAEEGRGGGDRMVKDGLFTRFPMDEIYGLHNWPYLAAGKIAVLDGPAMAAGDRLAISIRGLGGHGGATPHLTIDPVRISADLITTLHTIIGREIAPLDQAVLSLCAIQSGDMNAFNVIPDTAEIIGTVRTFKPGIQDQMEAAIKRICAGVAATYGADISVDYQCIIPATINTPACAQFVRETIEANFADGTLDTETPPTFGGEDFSYMLNQVPGAYIFLGSARHDEDEPLHSPHFDFNDDVIPTGAKLLTVTALNALER
ncbi:M20 aminoacylase family protein [Vibrio zhugei]|uniref:M20 aminoacylase family protein n=1 Tax=Vibrio zhugei TaxID=2479546 RepID=A0ABV7CD91_9VIBR|nr:M20 aminoacylase family protein [Vibrio zhugei]